MATVSMTQNAVGNVISGATITGSGTTNASFDVQTKPMTFLSVQGTFATGATGGIQIDLYRRIGLTSPVQDTVSVTSVLLPAVASTTQARSVPIYEPGLFNVTLTNTDASHSVTAVNVTTATVDGIA